MKRLQGKSNIDTIKDYVNGIRPFTQVGYKPELMDRKEGEEWKDSNGQKWIFKNGKNEKVEKDNVIWDSIKDIFICKTCGKNVRLLGDRFDNKMLAKTGNCFDCQIKYETELKRLGKFEDYEKWKIFTNQKSYCLDVKSKLVETIDYLKNKGDTLKYLNEDGSWDIWPDTMREKLLNDAEKDLKECDEALEKIETQLKELNFNV